MIPNLVTVEVESGLPWDFDHPGFDPKISKAKWAKIRLDPELEHCFISGIVGANPTIRVGKDNPAKLMRCLILDYDREFTDDEIERMEGRWSASHRPNIIYKTRNGGLRIIWLFEEGFELIINSEPHFRKLMEEFDKHLNFSNLMPNMDKKVYSSSMYWEAGVEYIDLEHPPLKASFCQYVHSQSMDITKDFANEGPLIPMEDLEAEITKRWPGRWTGLFEVGSKGCRFWDDSWNEPTTDTVNILDQGVYNFSTNKGYEGFQSWESIFGSNFVNAYKAEKIGDAILHWYFDGKSFWTLMEDGTKWVPFTIMAVSRHLRVDYGLDSKTKKDTISELDAALTLIEKTKFVDGIVPFVNNPDRVVKINGKTYLNSVKPNCVDPVECDVTPEDFSFIWAYLSHLVGQKQLPKLLAWMARAYITHYHGDPQLGQALILAGPAATGKTLFSSKIMGGLLGSVANGKSVLLEGSSFTSTIMEAAVIMLDDEDGAGDYRSKAKRAAVLKKMTASALMSYNKKHGAQAEIPWYGRLIVTCNDDDQSLNAMMPDLNSTIKDKLLALKVFPGFEFPNGDGETDAKIAKELPYFAKYLMQIGYEREDHRFGTKGWIHPDLEAATVQNSDSYGFREAVEIWRDLYKKSFTENIPQHWEGTAAQFWVEIEQQRDAVGKSVTNTQIGRMLVALIQQGIPFITKVTTNGERLFRIYL